MSDHWFDDFRDNDDVPSGVDLNEWALDRYFAFCYASQTEADKQEALAEAEATIYTDVDFLL